MSLLMADGGEDTMDVLQHYAAFQRVQAVSLDPLGREIIGDYLVLDENSALIEAAAVLGFSRVDSAELNPYNSSSLGLGQLFRHVISQGLRSVYIALGIVSPMMGDRCLGCTGCALSGCRRKCVASHWAQLGAD
ncbi:MAG: glycerate kinase, partial [Bacillota bacterium]|nr:glycerate kinase [Bacillota bacterium]